MSRFSVRLFALLWTASILGTSLATAGGPRSIVLDVPGMNCSLCPVTVRKALQRVPGVLAVEADLKTKQAVVHYDPDKVTPDRLAGAVTDAGYPARILENLEK